MIPKIIHYCWLSDDPFPESIRRTMDSWREKLPGYEFMHWDLKRFPLEKSRWVREAFEAKKYAFAADLIRLYAVYHHGGIYMDTDVEVVKPFDDLLHLPYFVGSEGEGIIEAGIFGAEKNCRWVGLCLDHYTDRVFKQPDGSYDMQTLPRIMMARIEPHYTIIEEPKGRSLPYPDDTLTMFPRDYFCAKNQGTGIVTKTPNTYTVHHFAMSWKPKSKTFLADAKRALISVLGERFVYGIINALGLKKIKSVFKR